VREKMKQTAEESEMLEEDSENMRERWEVSGERRGGGGRGGREVGGKREKGRRGD
jgi:hypothetical protein